MVMTKIIDLSKFKDKKPKNTNKIKRLCDLLPVKKNNIINFHSFSLRKKVQLSKEQKIINAISSSNNKYTTKNSSNNKYTTEKQTPSLFESSPLADCDFLFSKDTADSSKVKKTKRKK